MLKSISTKILIASLAMCFFASIPAEAKTLLGDFLKEKEIDIKVSGSLSYFDKYVWRGIVLDKDSVLQPSITISGYGFEGGFWGSWDLESKDTLSSDEEDGWIGYNLNLGLLNDKYKGIGLSFGHTWYNFSETNTYSKEYYVGLSLNTILSPAFKWFHDYAEEDRGGGHGNYYVLTLSHSVPIVADYGITFDLGGHLAYNDNLFISGAGGDVLLTVGTTIPLTENLKIQPTVNWSVPTGDVAHESAGNQREELFSGINLIYNF